MFTKDDQQFYKNISIVKYYFNLKISILIYSKMLFISVMAKLNFLVAIISVFSDPSEIFVIS